MRHPNSHAHTEPFHGVVTTQELQGCGRRDAVRAEVGGACGGRGGRGGVAEDAVDAADGGDGGGVTHALAQELLANLPGEDGRRLLLQLQDLAHDLRRGHLLEHTQTNIISSRSLISVKI